jgi:hypothetical protein
MKPRACDHVYVSSKHYVKMNTRTLLYLTAHITLHSDQFTWQKALQHSGYSSLPLNQHPRVLVQCVVSDVNFLLEERLKMFFVSLQQAHVTSDKHGVHWRSSVCKLMQAGGKWTVTVVGYNSVSVERPVLPKGHTSWFDWEFITKIVTWSRNL